MDVVHLWVHMRVVNTGWIQVMICFRVIALDIMMVDGYAHLVIHMMVDRNVIA